MSRSIASPIARDGCAPCTTGGQAEQCVDVALLQQVAADGLSGSALE